MTKALLPAAITKPSTMTPPVAVPASTSSTVASTKGGIPFCWVTVTDLVPATLPPSMMEMVTLPERSASVLAAALTVTLCSLSEAFPLAGATLSQLWASSETVAVQSRLATNVMVLVVSAEGMPIVASLLRVISAGLGFSLVFSHPERMRAAAAAKTRMDLILMIKCFSSINLL